MKYCIQAERFGGERAAAAWKNGMQCACTVAATVLDCVCRVDRMLGDHRSGVPRQRVHDVQNRGWGKLRYLSRGAQRGCLLFARSSWPRRLAVAETHPGRSHGVALCHEPRPRRRGLLRCSLERLIGIAIWFSYRCIRANSQQLYQEMRSSEAGNAQGTGTEGE
jgi:hypothetical protein